MILNINTEQFLYDITALIRAFFPTGEIIVSGTEKEEVTMGFFDASKQADNSDKKSGVVISVFQSDNISVSISENGKNIYDISEAFEGYNPLRDGKEELHKTSSKNHLRRGYKNAVKRLLYKGLCKYTGKSPAWGILTGVRPTKLAMEQILSGESKEGAADFLENTYLCSRKKAELAAAIAEKECRIMRSIGYEDSYSLYIGIPFCPTTCSYCSFASYSLERSAGLVDEYLSCLYREIDGTARLMEGKKPCCVYFGGGTPTALSAVQLDELLGRVRTAFPMENVVEFTVEAGRPDSITKEKLEVLKGHKVDRISINPQTMKDETLVKIGRRHSTVDIRECFEMARSLGFSNINMDLIVGLPDETVEDVDNTLREVIKMAPDSLTVHSMVLKRAAQLNREMKTEEGADSKSINRMVELGYEYAFNAGLEPYYMYRQKNARGSMNESRDNIGYAVPGKESIYNIVIMEEIQTIVALGAGAVTKRVYPNRRIDRCENVKDVSWYIRKTDEMIERKQALLCD